MKFVITIIVACVVIAGVLEYMKPFKVLSKDLVNGEKYFKEKCVACHGVQGYGDWPLAASFDKKPTDINTKFKTTWRPDNRLTRRILVGKPETGMPAFKGELTEADAEDILAYVRSIN